MKGVKMRIPSRVKWCLLGVAISVLVLVIVSIFIPGKLNDAVNSVTESAFARTVRTLTESEPIEENTLVEMVVDSIQISEVDYQPVVVLKEKGTERYLPIWIGFAEATAIEVILEGVDMPRPLTHDLLCSVVNVAGVNVNSIIINNLQNNTFYAKIVLSVNQKQIEIDSRPSDAIAIALRVGAPVYAKEAILDKAGTQLDHKAVF